MQRFFNNNILRFICEHCDPLSDRKDLTVFQNRPLSFIFLKSVER